MRAPPTVIPSRQPVLETRLATLLMGQLVRHEVDDTYVDIVLDDPEPDTDEPYYAAFELVRVPVVRADAATTQFVRIRDTTHDHIETVKFPKLEDDTVPVPQYSTPYALVEVEAEPPALRLPMTSVPFERVDVHDLREFARRDETEVIYAPAPRSRLVMVFLSIIVLACALLVGLGFVLLVS